MIRKAKAVWRGTGRAGNGHLSTDSGVLAETPYSFKTRFENEKGTNPEELIAAAHAGCFTMALAFGLQKAGYTPTELSTEAVTLISEGQGFRISRSALSLRASVPNIDERTFTRLASDAEKTCPGRIHGEAIEVPVLEATGESRIGRFGWKDQHSSLLSFIGDAYLNEMGVTNRLRPKDVTTVGKTTSDPEDVPDNIGLADIDHFAQFVRGTKAPPRDPALAATAASQAGQQLFERIGCVTCHVGTIVTAPTGTVINGGAFTVPEALGNKIVHPYGDFLLHDIGTGDGIVQNPPQDTANKLRTVPLWGLRMHPRHMHDLRSLTLEDAIERHRGEADEVRERFRRLSPAEKQQLITFLNSL